MSELLTGEEVLRLLKIKNRHVIGWLVERKLLAPIMLGPRCRRFEMDNVVEVIDRVKNEGLILTCKP